MTKEEFVDEVLGLVADGADRLSIRYRELKVVEKEIGRLFDLAVERAAADEREACVVIAQSLQASGMELLKIVGDDHLEAGRVIAKAIWARGREQA